MNILIVLVFISMILVMASVLFFYFTVRNRDIAHADQMSLLPLEEEQHVNPTSRLQ